MLTTFVLIIHLLVCIALILIILLQTGKGADIGAVFGGGSSQTVFGSTGATTFLSKVTIVAAVLFMCTSIVLTYFAGKGVAITERSVVTESSVPGVPAAPQPSAPAVPSAAPTTETAPASGGGQTTQGE
ncbi:MAG: preprotein translocase subunit SecG [Desulfomonilaceae bacterium]